MIPDIQSAPRPTLQRGVSLLEVMIAVVVLSFGLLGLAGLQVTSLKNNQSAMERSLAVVHTYTIIEAMRADRAVAESGGFNIGLDDDAPSGSGFSDVQIADWRARISADDNLGAGASGAVACNGTSCTVTIRWNDTRGLDGDAAQTISTQVQL